MLCYYCQKVQECPIFRKLYTKSADFSINDCKDYVSAEEYKYRKIATNDNLMRLIYNNKDHFIRCRTNAGLV